LRTWNKSTLISGIAFILLLIIIGVSMVAKANDAPPPEQFEPRVVIENNDWYVVWDEQRYGPFTYAHTDRSIHEDHVLFTAQDSDRLWHVYWGEVHHGPFEELVVKGVFHGKLLFYYRENGKYHVQWGEKTKGPFQTVRKLHYGSDGRAHFIGRAGNVTADVYWDGN